MVEHMHKQNTTSGVLKKYKKCKKIYHCFYVDILEISFNKIKKYIIYTFPISSDCPWRRMVPKSSCDIHRRAVSLDGSPMHCRKAQSPYNLEMKSRCPDFFWKNHQQRTSHGKNRSKHIKAAPLFWAGSDHRP